MAVEIRELIIKAIIVARQDDENASFPELSSSAGKDQIVQECVTQVLKIIRKNENR